MCFPCGCSNMATVTSNEIPQYNHRHGHRELFEFWQVSSSQVLNSFLRFARWPIKVQTCLATHWSRTHVTNVNSYSHSYHGYSYNVAICICQPFQRLVPIDSLQRQSKEALLELYYKNVLPMPQRSFKQNRHGRELTRRQIMLAKRKRTYSDMTATTWSGTNKAKE